MKENKKQIVIATSVLVVVTILFLGLTYAYYKTRINGNTKDKSISVTSKKLEITYADGNGVISPTEKIEPGYTTTKTFTVENTGDETLSYSIKLDNITNTFTRTEDWTYVLKKGETEVSSGVLPTNETYIVNVVSIDSKVTDSYSLTVTYANLTDVDQSVDMGKELSLRVNIDEAKITWNSAPEGTLLYAIKNDNTVTEPLTSPGNEASSETEAVLSSTEDDYGTSYYFRGNVKNNYLNFSGMCWRVVRIQGDGNIKITLADRDHECNSSDYSTSLTDSAFIVANDISKYPYNKSESLDYKNSTINNILQNYLNGGSTTFYDPNTYSDKTISFDKIIDDSSLTETEWCNDISFEFNGAVNAYSNGDFYGPYNRTVNTKSPTLKCNMIGKDGSIAVKIKAKVGLLTIDEIVFAGANYGADTFTHYLKDNTSNEYWTMSPASTEIVDSSMKVLRLWLANSSELSSNGVYFYQNSIRPALVLRSDVEITGGNGIQSNPYIVS